MKSLIILILGLVGMFSILPAIEVLGGDARLYILNEEELSKFELNEVITQREKNDEVRKDVWKGVSLSDIVKKYKYERFEMLEFTARDNYLVRLKVNDLLESSDIILALERNAKPLGEGKYRIIGKDLPEMHWISDITMISPISQVVVPEPFNIYPIHTILTQLRRYNNPKQFPGINGYRMLDLVTLFSNTSHVMVRIVSKDGMEQFLDFNKYLKNAYLGFDDNKVFSVYAPEMPTGMWQKDIMLIQVGGNVVVFYSDVDFKNSKAYQDFIKLVNQRPRTATFKNKTQKINNWENLKWEEILFIQ